MADESLQAEVERLRAEVEAYKQREVADLRSALAAARQESAHYRAEATRISGQFAEYVQLAQQKITQLQSQIDVREKVARAVTRANTGRN